MAELARLTKDSAEASPSPAGAAESAEATGLETPVVLIVFNRPELTQVVFSRIAEARPRKLLLVADGPRADRGGEAQRCEEVRRIVSAVHWDCDVKTNFAAENMGCRRRVISGLHWAFEQVEEAIILEDDILPDPSFFPFCRQMLARYRDDERVSMISGFNIGADRAKAPDDYFFSRLTHIWGWATWRRAWQHYDEHMTAWPSPQRPQALRRVFPEASALRYWTPILEGMHRGKGPNTWDYQWMFTNVMREGVSIVPQINLVQNLGFGPDATHPTAPCSAPRVGVGRLRFPLRHPSRVEPSAALDALDQELSEWHTPALLPRAVRKARRVLLGYPGCATRAGVEVALAAHASAAAPPPARLGPEPATAGG